MTTGVKNSVTNAIATTARRRAIKANDDRFICASLLAVLSERSVHEDIEQDARLPAVRRVRGMLGVDELLVWRVEDREPPLEQRPHFDRVVPALHEVDRYVQRGGLRAEVDHV